MRKRKEPTRLIRVPTSIHSALRMLSAMHDTSIVVLSRDLITSELTRRGLELDKLAGSVQLPLLTASADESGNPL